MSTTAIRQKNYRRRLRLHHTLISLKIYRDTGYGKLTINELYKQLLEEYISLEAKKGELNVRKK